MKKRLLAQQDGIQLWRVGREGIHANIGPRSATIANVKEIYWLITGPNSGTYRRKKDAVTAWTKPGFPMHVVRP